MKKYNPKEIEAKWQKFWAKNNTFGVSEDSKKQKFYGLVEFPYPSAEGLHVGHPRPFTAMDVISRKRRMQGYNVLFPMGFDAFGLPTENFAIKTGQPPAEVTKKNIANFTRQLKSLGYSFDWDRQVNTSDPEYYKWTQWQFLQFFKHGLAYKKNQPINWCPKDKTGLANEEVIDGCCERCGTAVEKRNKEQWMLAITKYADKLLEGLKTVDYITPARVQQENWIGKSEGLLFTAPVKDTNLKIQTFSAHFESCYADTFVAIAPDHPFLPTLLEGVADKEKILAECKNILEKRAQDGREEKEEYHGVFTGRYIVDPLGNGDLPIWVASFALADYGTGIVKCSAHDERDFAFAKKYGIRLKPVLFPVDPEQRQRVENLEECFTDMKNGVLTEPAQFAGKIAGTVKEEIIRHLEERGFVERKTSYKLRDWVFSRQHYWGEPIPLVYCKSCAGWIPLPESELPLKLPKVEKYQPTDSGESPLASVTDWVNTKCPKCGGPARRETDTMPNWAGSSWYFLRYCDPDNDKQFASPEKLKYWTPVDWYNGGMEHTVLHLLYSRFWNQFLYDIGVVPTREPYKKRTSHGMILGPDGEKMSKSRGNVINPDEMIEKFGTDAFRGYIMFMGPFDQAVMWDTNGLVGVRRFLEKVWALQEKVNKTTDHSLQTTADTNNAVVRSPSTVVSLLHQTIKKVSDDIEAMRFNTAIAKMMELANYLTQQESIAKNVYSDFVKLLSPFAPHLAEELWEKFGDGQPLAYSVWPKFDPALAKEETITVAVQVNGKVRDELTVDADIDEEEIKKLALASEKIQKWLEGKAPKKVIYVKGRLVSIVV